MLKRIRDYFDHPYRALAYFLIASSITMALLVIGITRALAADVTTNWTYPTLNTDGSSIPASGAGSITSSKVEWGSCVGSAFGTKIGEATIPAPTKTHTATGLPPATYCLRAYVTNTYGTSSDASGVVTVTVNPPKPQPPVITTATVARLLVPTRWGDQVGHVVGKVELGTECGAQRKGEWHEVSRETVTLNRWGARLPESAVIVARCGAG